MFKNKHQYYPVLPSLETTHKQKKESQSLTMAQKSQAFLILITALGQGLVRKDLAKWKEVRADMLRREDWGHREGKEVEAVKKEDMKDVLLVRASV